MLRELTGTVAEPRTVLPPADGGHLERLESAHATAGRCRIVVADPD